MPGISFIAGTAYGVRTIAALMGRVLYALQSSLSGSGRIAALQTWQGRYALRRAKISDAEKS